MSFAEGLWETINLKVEGPDNSVFRYKIDKDKPLQILMDAHCDRMGLSMRVLTFLFNGEEISGDRNPMSLRMHDGDTIVAYTSLSGGDLLK